VRFDLLCTVLLLSLVAAGARAETYDNPEYGFHLRLPEGRPVCKTPPPGPNHGFTLLLASGDCDHLERAQRIDVYVGSDAAYLLKSTAEMQQYACKGAPGGPSGLKIGGIELYRCDVPAKGEDLPAITYFALRAFKRVWPPSWQEFYVTLYCEKDGCAYGTRVLKRLFASIRLVPPAK